MLIRASVVHHSDTKTKSRLAEPLGGNQKLSTFDALTFNRFRH